MAEDARTRALNDARRQLERDLGPYRTHLARLLEHIGHMEQPELDDLQRVLNQLDGRVSAGRREIIKALRAIHGKEQCRLDREREGLIEAEPAEKMSRWATIRDGIRSLRDD
jgi:hypothetical protein